MQQWTEKAIRNELDGTFTRIEYSERGVKFVTDFVPKNFMPNFGAMLREATDPTLDLEPVRGVRASYWTEDQDRMLLDLRDAGMTFRAIGPLVGRTAESARKRMVLLRGSEMSA